VVRMGWTSGPDMAPLAAAVTALACMHMQRNVAAYWDRATRSGAWGAIVVWLVLFFLHELIVEFLVIFQVVLDGG